MRYGTFVKDKRNGTVGVIQAVSGLRAKVQFPHPVPGIVFNAWMPVEQLEIIKTSN